MTWKNFMVVEVVVVIEVETGAVGRVTASE
jgi:hypothetical protein